MNTTREVIEALGAEREWSGTYTGDYSWGSSMFRSPEQCLRRIVEQWFRHVDDPDALFSWENEAREMLENTASEHVSHPVDVTDKHVERLAEAIENHFDGS